MVLLHKEEVCTKGFSAKVRLSAGELPVSLVLPSSKGRTLEKSISQATQGPRRVLYRPSCVDTSHWSGGVFPFRSPGN